MEKTIRIITHNGTFHADEVFAVATLELLINGKQPFEIIRTRDPEIIKTGDYVVDVGLIYDPAVRRFDHHQKDGPGERNGIPYSSFGLVWKEYGAEISGSHDVADAIERKLCYPIDMGDNGIRLYNPTLPGAHPYLIQYLIMAFRPTWKEGEAHDMRFIEMVELAKRILKREIRVEQDKVDGMRIVEEIYQKSSDKQVILIDGQYPWHEILARHPEPLFIVKPKHQNTDWEVECVRDDVYCFTNRKSLPEPWAGLHNGELADVTGVPDAVFCHNNRYVAVARSREGALKLAELARDAQ